MQIKAKSFFTTVLVIVIVFVMALSGLNQAIVSDKQYVVKIGKSKVSIDEYKQAYQAEKNNLESMLGSRLSEEQLSSVGFHQTVLDKIVQSKLLENLAYEMSLKVGNDSIKHTLKQIPSFHDEKGNFSKEKFLSKLHNNNMTEDEYITTLNKLLVKQIILDSLKDIPGSYYNLAAKIYSKRFEKRSVDIAIFEASMINTNSQSASDEELKNFHAKHQNMFWSTERRSAEYITVDKKNIDMDVKLNEKEILKAVHNREDRIDISYLLFNTPDEAKQTIDTIGTKTIKDLTEHKLAKNIHRDMLPPSLLDIFSLAENEISQPIETPNGWYIFQIDKKYLATQAEREQAETEIRTEFTNNQLNERLEDLINTLEDKLSSGITAEELAATYHLTSHKVTLIDNTYHDRRLAQLIFNNNNQEDNSPLFYSFTGADGIEEYYHVKITEVKPPQPQEFEVCKEEVKKAWRTDLIKSKLYELATAKNSTFKNVKRENIFQIQAAYTESPQQNYPEDFIDQVFKLKPGELTLPTTYQGDKLIVGKLIATATPTENEVITKEIEEEIKRAVVEANYSELKNYLQNKFTVKVNQKP